MSKLIIVFITVFLVSGSSWGHPLIGTPSPHDLFKAYFNQLPAVLKTGYPDEKIQSADTWNTDDIHYHLSINETDYVDFHFIGSELGGFSSFNVTETFVISTDNATSNLNVSFTPAMTWFEFLSNFKCSGFVGGETVVFGGSLHLVDMGDVYARNVSYVVDKVNGLYELVEVIAEKSDFQIDAIHWGYDIELTENTPESVLDILYYVVPYQFLNAVFREIQLGYEKAELEIGNVLLRRLQLQ